MQGQVRIGEDGRGYIKLCAPEACGEALYIPCLHNPDVSKHHTVCLP